MNIWSLKGLSFSAIAVLCLGMVSCETAITSQMNSGAPVTLTSHGPIEGYFKDGIQVFKGVRYGADTSLTRFAAPEEPEEWSETRDAKEFGATCPQNRTGNPGGLFSSWKPDPLPPLSEDCLFLNVWTPSSNDRGERPVMVWFHGGGFTSGSGASQAYNGVRLANRGDVVVVTVNHRLNVFGYLALNQYGEGFEDSATAGVLDMVLALEWVKDNIRNFGGNPDNVMIFGESGGGAKVSTLLNTPAAEGLFHRAVVQSGAMIRYPDADRARQLADKVVSNLDLDETTIQKIKSLPIEEIQKAFVGTGAATAPSIDSRTLFRHPFDPDGPPSGKNVPLMLGTNRTENTLFAGPRNPALFDLDWDGLRTALQQTYPDIDADAVISGYRDLQSDASPSDIYFEATTDSTYYAGHVLQAERKVAQGGAPVWLYLFNWDTPVDGGKWRSPHALEIGFVFDNVAKSESISGVGPEQQRVADIMAETWIAFARNGDPNNDSIPAWPAYNAGDRPVMVLDETPELVNDARGAQRALMNNAQTYGNRYAR